MKKLVPWLVVAALAAGMLSWQQSETQASRATADGPEAVERDMHEFMEYVFQPSYRRITAAMAEEPQDNADWKAIKAEALTLAEAANLLFLRAPDDQGAAWNTISRQVRDAGGEFYEAARRREFAAARESYTEMINHCNRCHQEFAGGEYQLEP